MAHQAMTVLAALRETAQRTPDAPAIDDPEGTLRYGELWRTVEQLAGRLRESGIEAGDRVGVAVDRSRHTVLCLLALARAGAAYVPLDGAQPAQRLARMLAGCSVRTVIGRGEMITAFPAGLPVRCLRVEAGAEIRVEEDAEGRVEADEGALAPGGRAGPVPPQMPEPPPEDLVYVLHTSGSSADPKGVMVPHRALYASARSLIGLCGIGPGDRVLSFASLVWDTSGEEIYSALLSGATLVIDPAATSGSVPQLLDVVRRRGVTVVDLPTSYWNEVVAYLGLLDEDEGGPPDGGGPLGEDAGGPAVEELLPPSLRLVIIGGEEVRPAPVRAWAAAVPDRVRLLNTYGQTETVLVSHAADLGGAVGRGLAAGDRVPIGGPLPHVRQLLVPPANGAAEGGRSASDAPRRYELLVGGASLALGYAAAPEATAERFTSEADGAERYYRTGDVVEQDAQGRLAFIGRVDRQVKVRGHRVEPEEVERTLLGHPGLRAASVAPVQSASGDLELVASVVPVAAERTGGLTGEAVRGWLADRLPAYLLPARVAVLAELPLLSSGKVDHRATIAAHQPRPAPPASPPGTDVADELAELCSAVLGAPCAADADFFAAGGNSLLATRLISRVHRRYGVGLGYADVFERRTPAALAAAVRDRLPEQPPAAEAVLGRTEPAGEVPLSYAQQRLWFLNRLGHGTAAAYHIPWAVRLSGALDVAALQAALRDVVERHTSLRTVFTEHDGVPYQAVVDTAEACPGLTAESVPEGDVEERLAELAVQPFDLRADLPWRARLFAVGDGEWVLFVLFHHIAMDDWSMRPLFQDLSRAYGARCAGRPPGWSPLPQQYADYALRQRRDLGEQGDPGSVVARQLDYWRRQLSDLPDQLSLPADRPRPAAMSYRGGSVAFEVDARTHRGLLELSRESRCSLFMVLHAALAALLARCGAGTDIPVGAPAAGRADEAWDDLVGFFVNTLVLRTDVSGEPSFRELLERVRETDFAAYAHQDVPFERLVELLNPDRTLSRNPLFQVMLVMENAPQAVVEMPGLTASLDPVPTGAALFDLVVTVAEQPSADGATGTLDFSTDLFDRQTAVRLVDGLLRVLAAAATDPDLPLAQIDLLGDAERRRLLVDFNDTHAEVPQDGPYRLFEAQAARTPHATAVVTAQGELTYGELDAAACELARELAGLGAGPERCVALALPRGAGAVTAVLAVLKTGAAYLPLDPEHPAQRNAFILDDAAPVAVLTTRGTAEQLPDRPPVPRLLLDGPRTPDRAALPAPDHDPGRPAYVIYTSGTTGRPKGVVMTTGALSNLLAWQAGQLPGGPGTRVAQFTALTFDVATQEILSALTAGKTLVIPSDDVRRDPQALARWLQEQGVHELYAPNLVIDALCRAAHEQRLGLPDLRDVVQAGEALALGERARAFFGHPGRRLHNHYGPSETHVVAGQVVSPEELAGPAPAPIGRPVDNVRLYVLDSRMQPVPQGVPGELFVAGAALARGYLARPGLTARRFVPDPFGAPGARLYRTGDLVRMRTDGALEFLGRADGQVKIRGLRVEPAEIEAVLAQHPGVGRAAVVVREDRPGEQRLVAYVVAVEGAAAPDARELREHVAAAVPRAMVPAAFVALERLPLTAHNKLDRRALPPPDAAQEHRGRAPAPGRESELSELFAEVLGVARVGAEDSFFELGGHSMLAAQLAGRARAKLGAALELRDVYAAPTVAGLAARMEPGSGGGEEGFGALLALRSQGALPPVFCVHPATGLGWSYAALLRWMPRERPVYALQSPGLAGAGPLPGSVAALADAYAARVREAQPEGPYHLVGYSFGGPLAHAMACALQRDGQEVALLAVIDGSPMGPPGQEAGDDAEFASEVAELMSQLRGDTQHFAAIDADHRGRMRELTEHHARLLRAHAPAAYRGDLLLLRARPGEQEPGWGAQAWRRHVSGAIGVHDVQGPTHWQMLEDPFVEQVARLIADRLGVRG